MDHDALRLDFSIVDVFTNTRYEGNPLAIVRVPRSCNLSQDQKQKVAREFNLSETTFLHEPDQDQLDWKVDIFTTHEELPFAGHPTVGTACFVLSDIAKQRGEAGKIEALFRLKAGLVRLQYDVATKAATAMIPHDVRIHSRVLSRDELLQVQPQLREPYRSNQIKLGEKFPIVSIINGMTFVLVELENLGVLQRVATSGLTPSKADLDQGWGETFLGMYYFVRTDKGLNGTTTLRTRMIEGTLEDPATGSAASALAAYLTLVEGSSGEAFNYTITQGVEMGRHSDIQLRVVLGDAGVDEIVLGGSAVQVMDGRLTVEED